MNFLKFLFLGNFLFISFQAFILIKYYLISSKLFILSGLLFFKFLLRLLIFNILLYFILNLGINPINNPSKNTEEIVVVSKDFEVNGINENQIIKIINILQKREPDVHYSLSIFNPLTDSLGVLIPKTNNKVFLNFINHVDFRKVRPIYHNKYIPSNLSTIKINGETVFIKSRNELADLVNNKDYFLSMGENWFSINQLSIYLLFLLLILIVVDTSFKFQVLK
ncbi:MAG: hypothetical protein HQ448_11615 [Cytophagales bacterium]|nr:hypothetical protein [Cytophagales bacterium]